MEQEQEIINYREEILRSVAEGKIKHTTKYVEKASDETRKNLQKLYCETIRRNQRTDCEYAF